MVNQRFTCVAKPKALQQFAFPEPLFNLQRAKLSESSNKLCLFAANKQSLFELSESFALCRLNSGSGNANCCKALGFATQVNHWFTMCSRIHIFGEAKLLRDL